MPPRKKKLKKKNKVKKISRSKKTRKIKKPRIKKSLPKSAPEIKLEKAKENPIIAPIESNQWECWQTFNPGVILLENKIHFLYRAIGQDGLSRLGYANSSDGFTLDERLPYPVFEHYQNNFSFYSFASGGSFGGAEDPRLVRVENEDTLYLTYTACDGGIRVGFSSIKIEDFLNKNWRWRPPVLISPPGETHKNWVLFPEKINGKYALLHSISPKILIAYLDDLNFDGKTFIKSLYHPQAEWNHKKDWENYIRGAGAPPIKTKYGWLLFYHALEKGDDKNYKAGALLLDLQEPTKIITRSKNPILEPEEIYENCGFKPGIVYISGAIVKDNLLLVYYGGADSYVNVAYTDFEEFVENIIKEKITKFKIQAKKIKIKK